MFDLTIYPFNRIAGKEIAELPGLYTAAPPKKPARGREQDLLAMLVQFDDHGAVVTGAQPDVLEKLTTVFYNTRGTVTSALKAVVEQLNERLLARNLRVAKDGAPIVGFFLAAVLHGDLLYVAHSGPVHSYVIGKEAIQYFFDPQNSGKGLGISRTATVRFYRSEVQAGDLVLMSARPPEYWSTRTLVGSAQLPLGNIRRRLLNQAGEDVCFTLLRVKEGSGELKLASLSQSDGAPAAPLAGAELPTPGTVSQQPLAGELPLIKPAQQPATREAAIPPAVPSRPTSPGPARPQGRPGEDAAAPTGSEETREETPPSEGVFISGKRLRPPEPAQEAGPETAQKSGGLSGLFAKVTREKSPDHAERRPVEAAAVQARPVTERAPQPRPAAPTQADREKAARRVRSEVRARSLVSTVLSGWRGFRQKVGSAFSHLFAGVLPGQAERMPGLTTSQMLFVAIAVPAVVVTIGLMVYRQIGLEREHLEKLAYAQQVITQAQAQTDPTLMRVNYQAALDYLNEAAKYGKSDEMDTLFNQVYTGLDKLDGVQRLDMTHVATVGSDQVKFSRVVSTQVEDLYLLDSDSGSVARLVDTRPGYKLDNGFTCGPNMYGGIIVGPLVDIVAAPPSNRFDAVVLGVDAYGNLLYCSLDFTETTATALTPPDAGWGVIKAIYYDNAELNVIDTNSVWRYDGNNFDFPDAPRLFFGNDVPDVTKAVDISLYQDDLYVLNEDGHLTMCTYNIIQPASTRCSDPYPYNISLAGQPAQTVTDLGVTLTQELTTPPPEPAIYFLDAENRTVYQFSLGMNFVRKMALREADGTAAPNIPATAFTVTSGRTLVMALNNRIYTSLLPPP